MRAGKKFLVVGDPDRAMSSAVGQAVPDADVQTVPSWFDAITEAAAGGYTAILAAAEPIERRPEAAVRTLKEVAGGGGRLILFGHPTLEPLVRKMTEFGADDYVVTPPKAADLAAVLVSRGPAGGSGGGAGGISAADLPALLQSVSLTDLVLEALLNHPHNAPGEFVRLLNDRLSPAVCLHYTPPGAIGPVPGDGAAMVSCSLHTPDVISEDEEDVESSSLALTQPLDEVDVRAQEVLAVVAPYVEKLVTLQDRHNRLQKLAITDDLTGLYNGRYFRHFLARILETSRQRQSHVTLLMFDIDNFKKYNDQFGHGAGDEILKQTGALMRKCCREHDFVARISGDEFAVIFWEKEGPREVYSKGGTAVSSRPPQTPQMIFDRFQKLLAGHHFECLGPTAPGSLTISAGMATFPWAAQTAEGLIEAADHALMFGAKKGGKNSIHLVGGENQGR